MNNFNLWLTCPDWTIAFILFLINYFNEGKEIISEEICM